MNTKTRANLPSALYHARYVYSYASLIRAISAQSKEWEYQLKINKDHAQFPPLFISWDPIFIYKNESFTFHQVDSWNWNIFLLGTETYRRIKFDRYDRKYWITWSKSMQDLLDHMLIESVHAS